MAPFSMTLNSMTVNDP